MSEGVLLMRDVLYTIEKENKKFDNLIRINGNKIIFINGISFDFTSKTNIMDDNEYLTMIQIYYFTKDCIVGNIDPSDHTINRMLESIQNVEIHEDIKELLSNKTNKYRNTQIIYNKPKIINIDNKHKNNNSNNNKNNNKSNKSKKRPINIDDNDIELQRATKKQKIMNSKYSNNVSSTTKKQFWECLPNVNPIEKLLTKKQKLKLINNNIVSDSYFKNINYDEYDKINNWDNNIFREHIKEDETRNSILKSKNNAKFDNIGQFYPLLIKKIDRIKQRGGKITKDILIKPKSEILREKRNEIPIIVVPQSISGLITMKNALQFLKSGQFITKNDTFSNTGINERFKIPLKSKIWNGNKSCYFEIINNPLQNDFKRIVCIFVLGKRWQFKKWIKGWNKPEDVFDQCVGIHLHYDDEPPNNEVNKWKVHIMPISKTKRHDDARIHRKIWELIYKKCSNHSNKKLLY